jgi:hypothetical protein
MGEKRERKNRKEEGEKRCVSLSLMPPWPAPYLARLGENSNLRTKLRPPLNIRRYRTRKGNVTHISELDGDGEVRVELLIIYYVQWIYIKTSPKITKA